MTSLLFRVARVLVCLLAVGAWTPVPLDEGMFNNTATVDTADVVFIPGERWCPKVGSWGGEKDDVTWGKCLVGLVEGPPTVGWRPDWDHAMMACLAAGWPVDVCEESVGDGEF